MADSHHPDPTCDVAHGLREPEATDRTLVAVFASPVAGHLIRYARDAGYSTVVYDPNEANAHSVNAAGTGTSVVTELPTDLGDTVDVVVTDHHRDELGQVLKDALGTKARWIGVLGNPRHPGPHIEALAALGVPEHEIARVHRPVGLNIGSRTPPEIAISTLAGLLADRNGRPGGFEF
jgi:xanthine dehydrogenase accessory factor